MTVQIIGTLQKTELFRDLDNEVLRFLAGKAVESYLQRGELLFVAGDSAAGLFVIAEGSVRAFRSDIEGREQVIHVERAVATIAEVPVFDNGTYPSSAAAEERTHLYFIRKEDILSACRDHPDMAISAARLLAGRLRRCAELVESISLREVGQRVAKILLGEALARGRRTDGTIAFRQHLTHVQLAARIGTVREVVTRALTRLQNQGLIRLDGKNIILLDEKALRQYAES